MDQREPVRLEMIIPITELGALGEPGTDDVPRNAPIDRSAIGLSPSGALIASAEATLRRKLTRILSVGRMVSHLLLREHEPLFT